VTGARRTKPRFEVRADAAALARAVADEIAHLSRAANDTPVTIALSGGSTPKKLYETLAAPPLFDRVEWTRLEFFFGDERSVAPDHPDSNYGVAAKALLSKIPSLSHRMDAEHGHADAYERLVLERLKKRRGGIPVFDLILLGMGDDGHTASLFPGTAALDETKRLVVMNDVPQKHTRRMTFTYPLLNAADRVWVLIAGKDKRAKVAECAAALARGEYPYPMLRIEPTEGELVWWLDEAAKPA
jgi:6-phosphogluconolactonase